MVVCGAIATCGALAEDAEEGGGRRIEFREPAKDGVDYVIESSADYGSAFRGNGTISGRFPVTEFVVPTPPPGSPNFFRVRELSIP